jgi:hypothetical protein
MPGQGRVVTLDSENLLAGLPIQGNTTLKITHDIDLRGKSVNIPAGCTLEFVGGSIGNGTLVGREIYVKFKQTVPAFKDVMLKGTFRSAEFPINAYDCKELDYFYSFLQAFSGTDLYLAGDYSVTGYSGTLDGTMPESLVIDGRSHRMTLYSFGAHKVKKCDIKDITISCSNNITPQSKWKNDSFHFGIVGDYETSTIRLNNVTFAKECKGVYFRGFDDARIVNCYEDGSYFFMYDCNNVCFCGNRIVNATNGYYSIGRQKPEGLVRIENNEFRNISGGCVILTGGVKYNVSIVNNNLERVGGGGATKACVNIHPSGKILVSNNKILANKGAATFDIDAAREDMFSTETVVTVERNLIENVAGDVTVHSMALVGLGKLYFRNNTVKDQCLYFWDTPYMKFEHNTISYTQGFDANTNIGKMSSHPLTEKIEYRHYYRNNLFNIPYAKGYVKFEYLSKAKVHITGKGNTYSKPVSFVDQYKKFEATGDIKIYK